MKLLPISLDEEQINQIMDLGACNYTPDKIILLMGFDKEAFMVSFEDKESDLRQAYDAGILKAQFMIMNKQRELAESGNITAAQIFLKEAQAVKNAQTRDKILFDGCS
jgi:hypothetical protein